MSFYTQKVLLEGRNEQIRTFDQSFLVYFSSDENKYPIKKQVIGILVWIVLFKV